MKLDVATTAVPPGPFATTNGHTNRNSSASMAGVCTTSMRCRRSRRSLACNPAGDSCIGNFVKAADAAGRRVIVPDMIGFGCPRNPPRAGAQFDGHIANLTGLLRNSTSGRDMVCTIGVARRSWFCTLESRPHRALVIMSTWAWPLPPAEFHKRIFPCDA